MRWRRQFPQRPGRTIVDEISRPKAVGRQRAGCSLIALVVWVLLLLGAQYLALSPRWQIVLAGASAVVVLLVIFLAVLRLTPDFLTTQFFVGFQLQAAIFFVLTMLVIPNGALEEHPLLNILEHPFGSFVALISPSLGFVMFAVALMLLRRGPSGLSLREIVDRLSPGFERLLIVAALLQFSLWFTSDERVSGSLIAYGLRIVSHSVPLIPFLAGYLAFKLRRATLVWVMVFVIGIGFSFVTGSRGYVYFPLLAFLMGLFIGLARWTKRVQLAVILAPALAVAFIVASLVGERRGKTGRIQLSQVSEEGIGSITKESKAILAEEHAKGNDEAGLTDVGLARLVNWPNIAIPAMTPDVVPYRGFGDIGRECSSFLKLGRFSKDIYWSNVIANDYGFMVNEATSVEFGIGADGASRAGTLGAVLYGLIVAVVLGVLERVASCLHRRNIDLFLLCTFGLCSAGVYTMVRTGLFPSVRSALINLVVVSVFFGIVGLIVNGSSRLLAAGRSSGRAVGSRPPTP